MLLRATEFRLLSYLITLLQSLVSTGPRSPRLHVAALGAPSQSLQSCAWIYASRCRCDPRACARTSSTEYVPATAVLSPSSHLVAACSACPNVTRAVLQCTWLSVTNHAPAASHTPRRIAPLRSLRAGLIAFVVYMYPQLSSAAPRAAGPGRHANDAAGGVWAFILFNIEYNYWCCVLTKPGYRPTTCPPDDLEEGVEFEDYGDGWRRRSADVGSHHARITAQSAAAAS